MVLSQQEQKEEVNGKGDDRKKVPVLTLSLCPGKTLVCVCVCYNLYAVCVQVSYTHSHHVSVTVVMLETLNPALQKQESASTNGKVRNTQESEHSDR